MFCFASACGGSVEDVADSWEVALVAGVGVQDVSGTEKLLLSVVVWALASRLFFLSRDVRA